MPKPSLLCALVCASVVAAYDRSWLAGPVSALIPAGGPRPDRLSRLKARVLASLEALVAAASRRGRPPKAPPSEEAARAPLLAALLAVATSLLAESRRPLRRRAVQERLVAAYDRLHHEHGATVREFCAALAVPERTFRSWRVRPAAPPAPAPAPEPAPPRPRDRATGRFALEATAPGVQLGGDTTDLSVLGVPLKLVGVQDLGAREQRLWEAFALDERETAGLVGQAVAAATAAREGLQLVTDQGKPYLAQAARDAYDALAVEHAPQKEGAPTEKATVERAFATVKQALAPLLALTDRLAAAAPALRRPDLARTVGTLLVATFLRVYVAGRRHLSHPLEGKDPDVLRAIVEEQRERARAEDRSARLFLEALHAEYAMPGSREAFVRAFRRYPLEDLREAERRFRAYACRCVARLCDRYFAAVLRDVHERGQRRRAAERAERRAAAERRHAERAAAARAADLDAHPERRLFEGLDLLAETWCPAERRFAADGAVARLWLRRAALVVHRRDPGAARDDLERHFRAWVAGRPALAHSVRDAVRGLFLSVITEVSAPQTPAHPAAAVGAILASSARAAPDNPHPSRPPHLRI
jgi:hypothetical protein